MNMKILKQLENAFASNEPDLVEEAINLAWRAGMDVSYVSILNKLLLLTWHFRHEDIAIALQELKNPESIEPLFLTVQLEFEYLSYDEDYALARKCIWALADIGTEEAKSKLSDLARSDNKIISSYAVKRLNEWKNEGHRKSK